MNSPIRFTGLTSGMDTQGMVQQIMRAESMRMTRLTQRRQILQWRQEDLRSTRNVLIDFQNRNANPTTPGAIANTLPSGPWNTMRSSITNSSGEPATGISVTPTNDARPGSFSVEVQQVAQGDLLRGSVHFAETTLPGVGHINQWTMADITNTATFAETVTINGVNFTVTQSTTVNQFLNAVNSSDAGVNMSFNSVRGRFEIEHRQTGADATITTGGGRVLTGMGLQNASQVTQPGGVSDPIVSNTALLAANVWQMMGQDPVPVGAQTVTFLTPGLPVTNRSFTIDENSTVEDFIDGLRDALEPAGVNVTLQNGRITLSNPSNIEIDVLSGAADGLLESLGFTPAAFYDYNGTTITTFTSVDLRGAASMEYFGFVVGEYIQIGAGTPSADNQTRRVTVQAGDTFESFMARLNTVPTVDSVSVEADGSFRLVLNSSSVPISGAVADTFDFTPDVPDDDDRFARTAQNAILIYDGDFEIEQATNTFNLHGVVINLANNVAIGEEFTISNERNVDDAMQAIREFIDEFNTLMRYLNSLHGTARPRAGNNPRGAFFEPLTDEQRAAMSDREVEQWEAQARVGMLHRDSDIRNIQAAMREAMMGHVVLPDGSRLHLTQIGINTVGFNSASEDRMTGILEIFDEDALRAALESDPDRVQALFARHPVDLEGDYAHLRTVNNAAGRNARASQIGLASRLRDVIDNVANDPDSPLRRRAGAPTGTDSTQNILSNQIRDYNQRIDRMQEFLIRRESTLFAMFARMEQAMAQSNQQMDALFAFMMQ